MRVVLQRVSSARVVVGSRITGQIGRGILVLLGVAQGDVDEDAKWLAEKTAALRIFEDDDGKMNRSVVDIGGEILVVSQFTLLASMRKGTRPSFNDAARPEVAVPLYEAFIRYATASLGRAVATGEFGAMMKVDLINDGPVTLLLDTRQKE